MAFSLLTYNVLFNQACDFLGQVFKDCQPDVFCLQEVETNEANLKKIEKLGYRLADYSNSFIKFAKILGVATYYNSKKLEFIESKTIRLPYSIYEVFLIILRGGNRPRTVLKTDFIEKETGKKFTLYNVHFSTWATNQARNRQIIETINSIDPEIIDRMPTIIAGDFNYPYGRKKFESIIKNHHFKEATNNLFFTFETKIFGLFKIKLKDDYILYRNIKLLKTKRIYFRKSDHYPIFARFELK
ncbi:MAG: endonuclease/exonuclease/phosphatase family protein [Microgenomates group bacterium]|nr:endonuclease/exonuclease/phosphatase family protein [Microgenomates group bacterium]